MDFKLTADTPYMKRSSLYPLSDFSVPFGLSTVKPDNYMRPGAAAQLVGLSPGLGSSFEFVNFFVARHFRAATDHRAPALNRLRVGPGRSGSLTSP